MSSDTLQVKALIITIGELQYQLHFVDITNVYAVSDNWNDFYYINSLKPNKQMHFYLSLLCNYNDFSIM